MRKFKSIKILLILMLFTISVIGQGVYIDYSEGIPNEKYHLSCDRSVYAVNEIIQFSAFNLSPIEMQDVTWSKLIYVELITHTGASVYKGKYLIENKSAKGKFIIPSNLATGMYYLRTYTQWMRNFSPYRYSYIPITIINPGSEELLISTKQELDSLSFQPFLDSRNGVINFKMQESGEIKLNLKMLEKVYGNKLNVSVVRESGFIRNKVILLEQESRDSNEHIPETRSTSISGRVLNAIDSTPMAYKTVNLTLFGENRVTYGAISGDDGSFYFSIPEAYGETELFIAVQNTNTEQQPIILVNNDFCNKKISLPSKVFLPDSIELAYYESAMINSQLLQVYYGKHKLKEHENLSKQDTIQFYGNPSLRLVFNDFIELPTLSEYINELLVGVNVQKVKGTRRIKIQGKYAELQIFEPLLMIDNVAMPDAECILSLSPQRFKQIDVVNKPYIIGDIMYGGIVHFISKNNDLGGVDLPQSGKFFSFKLFAQELEEAFPSGLLETEPDTRNTIYWNPEVELNSKGQLSLTFDPLQAKGKFDIIVEGVDMQAQPFLLKESIVIP